MTTSEDIETSSEYLCRLQTCSSEEKKGVSTSRMKFILTENDMCCLLLTDCWLPLLVIALTVWSYYAYVFEFCVNTIYENPTKQISYLVVYHFLIIMFAWTYFKVMCTDIAVVPFEYKIPKKTYDLIKQAKNDTESNRYLIEFCSSHNLNLMTRNEEGYIRFCNKCKHVKPDRAHHCSTCGTCVLKMDHHCPWTNNCVGFSNYKFFVQFVTYVALYCIFYAGTTSEFFLWYFAKSDRSLENINVVIAFVVSFAMSLLMSFFSCYHLYLVSHNVTTLESMREIKFVRPEDELTYDLGMLDNFNEVFGSICWFWFIPINCSEADGVNFPMRMVI